MSAPEAHLLDRMRGQPGDRAARQVYADWLTERVRDDRPARAAQAAFVQAWLTDDGSETRRRQRAELTKTLDDDWLAAVRGRRPRYAILSDVHGNLEALDAVLADAERHRPDYYVCLGDTVNYGASPRPCLARIRARVLPRHHVAGNHDHAVIGRVDIDFFGLYARRAVLWTRDQLTDDDHAYLASLELVQQPGDLTLVHGALLEPALFDYLSTLDDARANLDRLRTRVAFCGHSHVPGAFVEQPELRRLTPDGGDAWELTLGPGKAWVDVGSVGQPRDADPRAAYALYDAERHVVTLRRVAYDIETAARRITDAGLSAILAERLYHGR